MCAKVCKPLTSFHLASLLLVWDPIFSFKCMMYDVLFMPYLFARDFMYMLGLWYLYSYAYMVFEF